MLQHIMYLPSLFRMLKSCHWVLRLRLCDLAENSGAYRLRIVAKPLDDCPRCATRSEYSRTWVPWGNLSKKNCVLASIVTWYQPTPSAQRQPERTSIGSVTQGRLSVSSRNLYVRSLVIFRQLKFRVFGCLKFICSGFITRILDHSNTRRLWILCSFFSWNRESVSRSVLVNRKLLQSADGSKCSEFAGI